MRSARANDHWKRFVNRDCKLKLEEFAFENLIGLGRGKVTFSNGITGLCGANGVGKSTLMGAIRVLLGDPGKGNPICNLIAGNAKLQAKVFINNAIKEILFSDENSTKNEHGAPKIYWLDPAEEVSRVRRILTQTNLEELLEQYTAQEFNNVKLLEISQIVGKNYTECFRYEIDENEYGSPFPYFKVRAGGSEYTSNTMGAGELALHLMYWVLDSLDNDSLLLLEEPETFIAPRSQEYFMDYLAKKAEENGIWVILTTHSPSILKKIPLGHTRLISRAEELTAISSAPGESEIDALIRFPQVRTTVLIVEDNVAKIFLEAIIQRLNQDLLRKVEIVTAGDESTITCLRKKFPRTASWPKLVGIYDGDQQGKIPAATAAEWPYCFLPGSHPPERILKETAAKNHQIWADIINISNEQAIKALGESEGKDHHDWLPDVCHYLNKKQDEVVSAMTSAWLEDEAANKATLDFLRGLNKSMC